MSFFLLIGVCHLVQVTVKSITGPAQHLFKGITFEMAGKNGRREEDFAYKLALYDLT
jgi:hypothetical protein